MYRSFLLVFCILLFTGCTSVHNNKPMTRVLPAEMSLETKADTIRALGIPSKVDKVDGVTIYTYQRREGYGGGLGVGNPAVNFLVSNVRFESDSYVIELNEENEVLHTYSLVSTDDISYSIWPFGKGGD